MQDNARPIQNHSAASPALHDHIQLHLLAAEQLEQAAAHNRKAVECYELGDLERARFHAYVAEGHYIDAGPLAERLSGLATTIMFLGLRTVAEGSRGA